MSFVSRLYSDLRRARFTGTGGKSAGTHKTYPRMERIRLPDQKECHITFGETLAAGTAIRDIQPTCHSLQTFGTLFGMSLRPRPDSLVRPYPSHDSLYPIEVYMISDTMPGMTPCVLHYNPDSHAFELLWELPHTTIVQNLYRNSPGIFGSNLIVLTALWGRSSQALGDYSLITTLLEIGHATQNILLAAAALDIPAREMISFNDEEIVRILDLDSDIEQPVSIVVL